MKRERLFEKEEAFLRLRAENSQAKGCLPFREKEKRSNQWTLSTKCVKTEFLSD